MLFLVAPCVACDALPYHKFMNVKPSELLHTASLNPKHPIQNSFQMDNFKIAKKGEMYQQQNNIPLQSIKLPWTFVERLKGFSPFQMIRL